MGNRQNQFGRGWRPDGEYTTIKHENGTINKYFNNAIIQPGSFEGVEDGDSFSAKFINRGPSQTNSRKRGEKRDLVELTDTVKLPTRAKRQTTIEPSPTGFPTPEMYHPEGIIGGYYLNDQGYTDVAVLSVPSCKLLSHLHCM